jgi:hypothetical protein
MISPTIPSIRSRLRFFEGFQLSAASVSSDTLLATIVLGAKRLAGRVVKLLKAVPTAQKPGALPASGTSLLSKPWAAAGP